MTSPKKWLRREFPSLFTEIVTAIFIVALVGALLLLGPLGYWVWTGNLESRYIVDPILVLILTFATVIAATRPLYLHPAYRGGYRAWLATTPWRRGLPLPIGPIHPSLGELLCYVVLLGIALLLRQYSSLTTSQVFAGSLFPFIVIAGWWTLANFVAKERGLAAVTLAIPPSAAMLIDAPWFAGLLLMACPIVAYFGVYRSLARFPWDTSTLPHSARIGPFNSTTGPKSNQLERKLSLGWPYTTLIIEPPEWVQSPKVAAIEGGLAGGWVFALGFVSTSIDPPQSPWTLVALLLVLGVPTGFIAFFRLIAYGQLFCERLCFGWRLGLGRWIVPAHDSILIVPLVAVLLAVLIGLSLYYQAGLIPPIASGIGVAVGVFILRAVGPRVTVLYYTGVHNRSPRDNEKTFLANRVK
jgi:hypothetical protein